MTFPTSSSSTTNPSNPSNPSTTPSTASSTATIPFFDQDIYACSELERLSSILSLASTYIQELLQLSTASNTTMDPMTLRIIQHIDRVIQQEIQQLLTTILTHFEHYLLLAMQSTPVLATPEEDTKQDLNILRMERCFMYCIRALINLQGQRQAESLFYHIIIEDLCKTYLTIGKLDGKYGRGSFSGLQESLLAIIDHLSKTLIPLLLQVTQTINLTLVHNTQPALSSLSSQQQTPRPINFLINGIWKPIITYLQEKFIQIFTIALPEIFITCYQSVHTFTQRVFSLIEQPTSSSSSTVICSSSCSYISASSSSSSFPSLIEEFYGSSEYQQFVSMWNIDLYSQLRVQEMCTRMDSVCHYDVLGVHLGLVPALSDLTTQYASNKELFHVQYHPMIQKLLQYCQTHFSFGTKPLFVSYAIEFLWCQSPLICMSTLIKQFVSLQYKLIQRLCCHIVFLTNVPQAIEILLQTMNKSAMYNNLDQLRTNYLLSLLEVKKTLVTLPNSSPQQLSTQMSSFAMSNDHLLEYLEDFIQFYQCVVHDFPQLYTTCFEISSFAPSEMNQLIDTQAYHLIYKVTKPLWMHWKQTILQECKKVLLQNVKTIAGKYRMTNKPAPSQASPYVHTILTPIK